MPSFSEITPEQLFRLIGTSAVPAIIDVSIDEDVAAEPFLVPGARRHPHDRVAGLGAGLQGQRAVIVCQRGKKLSHGAAAILRAEGIETEVLAGGNIGWRDAGLPRVPIAALPRPTGDATLWVTRHRPKIDRIACPWLLRRFVDPGARILFVPPSEVEAVAERFGATPFDIEGTFWSHRGPACTFDVMIEEFGLSHPALDRLAVVVRGADTNRHDLAPEAAGLLAISVGLSRAWRDDLAQLEAGMIVYDALYRWARDGADEGHDWPADRKA